MENNNANSNVPVDNNSPMEPTIPPSTMPEEPSTIMGMSGTPIIPGITENKPPYEEDHQPMANKSKGMLFTLIGIGVFLLLFSVIGIAVLAAYNKISLPDKKLQEVISYYVQDLPFMPKTPKYLILKSADVHKNIGSAYTKLSLSAKANEFKQIPGLGDTLEFLIEGPVDSTVPENPKISWNLKLTRELDVDMKLLDKIVYFKINKIPSIIYPFIGLTASNFQNNPLLNKWVYYDMSGLETDASGMLDKRGEDVTMDEITEQKLILIGEKLADKMIVTTEDLEGTTVNKINLRLTNAELQELEPELTKLFDMKNAGQYETSYQSTENPFATIDNFEINLWIEKETYYMRRIDFAMDIHNKAMNDYSQVLGIKTVANEDTNDSVISIAMSASLSKFGETFDADFIVPANATTFEQYMLEVSDFFSNQMNGGETESLDGTGFNDDDLSGFEDAQIYSPPTGKR